MSSTHEQDWTYFTQLLDNLGIEYRYEQIKSDKSKSSQIRIVGSNNVKIFGDYIYQNYDTIGLKRKYDKYREICSFSTNKMNPVYHTEQELFNMAKSGMSIRDVMNKYNYTSGLYEYIKKYNGLKELFDKNSNQSKPLSDDKKDKIIQMIKDGYSYKDITDKLGVKKGVIYNIKKLKFI